MAHKKIENPVIMEGVRIIFRNFSGKPSQFNPPGKKNFCVLLDQELAAKMHDDGWNIKVLKPREEGDPEQPYIQVTVNYDSGKPPRIVLLTSNNRTDLTAEMVEVLDYADIQNVDLIINPFNWDVNGKKGVTAYLKSAFITLNEDELELKYADTDHA